MKSSKSSYWNRAGKDVFITFAIISLHHAQSKTFEWQAPLPNPSSLFLPWTTSCSEVISAQWLLYVFWIPYSVSPWIFIALFSTFPAICEQSLLLSSPWSRRRKGGSDWIASNLWSHRSPNWTGQSYLFSSNRFFDREHSCINISMIVTEPAVPDARLLGLGSVS